MPSPCNQSEERIAFNPDAGTLNLGVPFCPFLNKPCKPEGCPFAADPKYRKDSDNA